MEVGRLGAILGRKIRESLFDMNCEKELATPGPGDRDVHGESSRYKTPEVVEPGGFNDIASTSEGLVYSTYHRGKFTYLDLLYIWLVSVIPTIPED